MKRFARKSGGSRGILLSAGVFLLVLVLFCTAASRLQADTVDRQRTELETALRRCILTCYAMEGSYPESLDYLRENYPLHYNEDLFFVDYKILGANLMPDVTIIERGR